MAEENQVQQEPQEVTIKDPKKVEVGRRLAAHNRKKREAKKREEQAQEQKGELNQYYSIGAVLAVGVIGGLGYYFYKGKEGEINVVSPPPQQPRPQSNKFEMD